MTCILSFDIFSDCNAPRCFFRLNVRQAFHILLRLRVRIRVFVLAFGEVLLAGATSCQGSCVRTCCREVLVTATTSCQNCYDYVSEQPCSQELRSSAGPWSLMEADAGAASSSSGENVFIGVVWDRPWTIIRDAYASLRRFAYALRWSQYVFREYEASRESGSPVADGEEEEGMNHLGLLLNNVHEFASDATKPFSRVIIEDLECDVTVRHPAMNGTAWITFGTTAQNHGLNEGQKQALETVFDEKVSLIHGPPGTGKTRTLCCILDAFFRIGAEISVSAPSNDAVNVICKAAFQRLGHTMVRWAPRQAEAKMSQSDRDLLRPILCPDLVRRRLIELRYDPDANAFGKHVKEKGAAFIADRTIVASTCFSAASPNKILKNRLYDLAVIDEAAQGAEPEVLSALLRLRETGTLVLIGDHKQLPATEKAQPLERNHRNVSMFERLMEQGLVTMSTLSVQHRMHPSIAAFPNCEYYGGVLQSCVFEFDLPRGFPWPSADPVAFVNISSQEEERNGSKLNRGEAAAVVIAVRDLLSGRSVRTCDFLILSPYACQVVELKNQLHAAGLAAVSVSTIDKAQGSEARFVILSVVRCNANGQLGFVSDARRLNVAMTRAKRGLLIFGCQLTLTWADPGGTWTPFFRFCQDRHWIVNAPASVLLRPRTEIAAVEVDVQAPMSSLGKLTWVSEQDGMALLVSSIVLAKKIAADPQFRIVMNYVVSLPLNEYRGGREWPSDSTEWDRKIWSHQHFLTHVAIPADATNIVYLHCLCLILSVHTCIPPSWHELLSYQSHLQNWLSLSQTLQMRTENDSGDIFEAVGAICRRDFLPATIMREHLVSRVACSFRNCAWLFRSMGALAEELFLVIKRSPIGFPEMHTALEIFRVPEVDASLSVEPQFAARSQSSGSGVAAPSSTGRSSGSGVILRPPQIDDNRFEKICRNRDHKCDYCGSLFTYATQSLPFDGQYVKHLGLLGEDPWATWRQGKDFRWWCTNCWAELWQMSDLTAVRQALGLLVRGTKRLQRAASGRESGQTKARR